MKVGLTGYFIGALALISLAGCTLPPPRPTILQVCTSYGFVLGTPAFGNCIMRQQQLNIEQQRVGVDEMIALHQMMTPRPPPPLFIPNRPLYLTPSNPITNGIQALPTSTPTPRLAPNGTYVGGTGPITLCPDGSYVSGQCELTPNGTYVGQ
jgi:hypothetical protein